MKELIQRLHDRYVVSVEDNVIEFMNEYLGTWIPRKLEKVKLASRRQDEAKYEAMRKRLDGAANKLNLSKLANQYTT